jgi:hypothetical protein
MHQCVDRLQWINTCVVEENSGRHMTLRRLRKSINLGRIATPADLEPDPADIYVNGRHNGAGGFAADLEKYLEAALAGWRVVRLGPNELTTDCVGRLVSLVSDNRDILRS